MQAFRQVFSIVCLLCVFWTGQSAWAANYYIDYDNGQDTNDGATPETAWKHCPGDGNVVAGSVAAGTTLAAGDTVFFKGGVIYRGRIRLDGRYTYGSPGHPITFKGNGWGAGKAIIDGSDPIVALFTRCASQSACANNPNWANIYYVDLSGAYSFQNAFFEDDSFLWYAQDPNPADPFYYDRIENLRVLPVGSSTIFQTATSITDPRYFTQTDPNFWNGAYVIGWGLPNVTRIVKVTGFDPATHTIYHEDLGSLYTDRDTYYSVLNHLSLIDTPGEYSFDENLQRLYLWPRNSNIHQHTYSVTNRADAFFSDASHTTIEGFIVQKAVSGIRVFRSSGRDPAGTILRNNEIRNLKSNDLFAIQASGNSILVENNVVDQALRAVGIMTSGNDVTVHNNTVRRASRLGIWFMNGNRAKLIGNTVSECKGTHANGMSVYTGGAGIQTFDVTVSGNRVSDSNIAFTFSTTQNIDIVNNVFLSQEAGSSFAVANWSGMAGTVNFYNNTVLHSASTYATLLVREDDAFYNFKNNIVSGAGATQSLEARQSRSNNIYTKLSWEQDARYGWQLGDGEFVETDLAKIFLNPASGDYRLTEGSVAIDKGLTLSNAFARDIQNTPRPRGLAWDIGAYEYVSGDTTPPAAPSGLMVR